jgi:hypothetical protein
VAAGTNLFDGEIMPRDSLTSEPPIRPSEVNERIAPAVADWRDGRTKLPEFDNQEFVPLPSGPSNTHRA